MKYHASRGLAFVLTVALMFYAVPLQMPRSARAYAEAQVQADETSYGDSAQSGGLAELDDANETDLTIPAPVNTPPAEDPGKVSAAEGNADNFNKSGEKTKNIAGFDEKTDITDESGKKFEIITGIDKKTDTVDEPGEKHEFVVLENQINDQYEPPDVFVETPLLEDAKYTGDGGVLSISSDGEWEYNLSGGFATIAKYNGYDTSLAIPDTIDGYIVTAIGNSAFANNLGISELILPDSLLTIGQQSFRGCSQLYSVMFNNGLTTIGNGAFYDCVSLGSLDIPDSVTAINSSSTYGTFRNCSGLVSVKLGGGLREIQLYTFYNCTELSSVTIGDNILTIGASAFYNCSQLSIVNLNGVITSIGDHAFYNCENLLSVVLPAAVKTIGQQAFKNCVRLKTVVLNDGLATIGSGAFYGCSAIETLDIPGSVTTIDSSGSTNGTFQNCANLVSLTGGSGLRAIQQYAFSGCTELASVTIGDNVTSIESYAFTNCGQLSDLTIGGSVATIGANAFQNCESLTSADLPDTMRSIGQQAFKGCSTLKSISLKNGLTTIGNGAFYGCASLESLDIPGSVTVINSGGSINGTFQNCVSLAAVTGGDGLRDIQPYIFYGCTALVTASIGKNASAIGNNAFYNCSQLSDFTVGNAITSIGDNAFYNCSNLQSVNMPNSLKTIGQHAFRGCSRLRSVILNDGLTTIGSGAFYECSAIETLKIPDSVSTINSGNNSDGAFRGCVSLTAATVGDGLQSIQPYMFYGCTLLTEINIGNKISIIGNSAFYGANLQFINLPDTVTSIGQYAFYNCRSLASVSMGGVLTISNNAFQNNISLRSLNFGNSLRSIGAYAFSGCISLPEINIPNSAISIGDRAFQGCRGLTGVQIGGAVASIGESAFVDCTEISEVQIGNNVRTIGSNAFRNNTSLEKLTIGASVVTIGSYAFYGDSKLQSVVFPSTLRQIENNAFSNCSQLVFATIPPGAWKFGTGIDAGAGGSSRIFANTAPGFTIIGVPGSPAEEFAMNNGYLFEALGDYVTLDLDESTNKAEINVSGSAPGGKVVSIYDGDVKIGEFTVALNRRYGGKVFLAGGYGDRTISAEIIGDDGETIRTTQNILYKIDSPGLLKFVMYHDKQRINLMTEDGIRQTLIFHPGYPFTFEVKFDNSEQIKKLFVQSERNGYMKRMEAFYDANKDEWLASGYFDPYDKSYVPGKITLSMTERPDFFEAGDIKYDFSKAFDARLLAGDLAPEWKNASYEILLDEPDKAVVKTVFAGDETAALITTYQINEVEGVKYDQLAAEGYAAITDINGKTIYARLTDNTANTSGGFSSRLEIYVPGYLVTFVGGEYNPGHLSDIKIVVDTLLEGASYLDIYDRTTPFLKTVSSYVGYGIDAWNAISNTTICMVKTNAAVLNGWITQSEANYIITSSAVAEAGIFMGKVGFGMLTGALAGEAFLAGTAIAAPAGPFAPVAGFIGAGLTYFAGDRVSNYWAETIRKGVSCDGRQMGISNGVYQLFVDPSGYVYEAVTANRLPGVTVTVYGKADGGDLEAPVEPWDASEYEQKNPLITDNEGRYAWDVPEGLWQVKAELEGYETAYSEWMPVPPPQMDVNIAMVSKETPEIAWFNVYEKYAEVEFSKYMKPETVNSLALKAPGGAEIAYTLEFASNERSAYGVVYAKRYRLVYIGGYTASNGTYALMAGAAVLSYAGAPASEKTYTAVFTRPVALIAPERVDIEYGAVENIAVEILNYDASTPLILEAESDFGFIADVKAVGAVDSNGRAIVQISGNLPGMANITLRIAGTGAEAILTVWVNMPVETASIIVMPGAANVSQGGTLQFSATDEATGDAAAVRWSVSGNLSTGTQINETGLLNVAADETSESLTITATARDGSGRTNSTTVHVASVDSFLLGDVNFDGLVNMQDVLIIYQYFRAKTQFSPEQRDAADINRNGAVDMQDVLRVYQYFRGKITTLN